MSKKQVRYDPKTLLDDPENFPRTEMNYVLKNKKVILGRIQSHAGDKITIRNSFRKKITIPTAEIAEIWAEEKVEA